MDSTTETSLVSKTPVSNIGPGAITTPGSPAPDFSGVGSDGATHDPNSTDHAKAERIGKVIGTILGAIFVVGIIVFLAWGYAGKQSMVSGPEKKVLVEPAVVTGPRRPTDKLTTASMFDAWRSDRSSDYSEAYSPPWFEDRPKRADMYDFTTRLNTSHLSDQPWELCRAYSQDAYSRDCV